MGLESATYISGLNASNPINATDVVGEGDDHIRLLKSTLLNTFPSITGEVSLTHTQINNAAIKNESNTFNGGANAIILANANALRGTDTGATVRHLISWDSDDIVYVGSTVGDVKLQLDSSTEIELNATAIDINGAVDVSNGVTISGGDALMRTGGVYGWSADANTYISRPSADTLGLTVGGTQRMSVSAAEIDLTSTIIDVNGELQVDGFINLSSTSAARLLFDDSAAGSGLRFWEFNNDGGAMLLFTRTDAGSYVETAIGCYKNASGEVTSVVLAGDAISLNGVVTASGRLIGNGSLAIQGSYASGITGVHAWADVNGSTARFGGATTGGSRAAMRLWGSSLDIDMNGGGIDFNSETVTTDNASAAEVGYKGAPPKTQNSDYTLVLSDAGNMIRINSGTGGTITIPANSSVAFPVGTVILIANDDNNVRTLAIDTDTLRQGGTTNTGSRTIGVRTVASLVKVDTTVWIVSGAGVT